MDKTQFYNGNVFDAYNYMGAHCVDGGVRFVTYAPNAESINIIGEFSDWQEYAMYRDGTSDFFSVTLENAKPWQMYKYVIYGADGQRREHCDPYGRYMELRPGSCSIIVPESDFEFDDDDWISNRSLNFDRPMNIYELHLGSWKKPSDDESDWYSYDELSEMLPEYLSESGYTHVEFMPLAEHPFDGSWGYQNTGFFAPTSRYGKPDGLKKLVNELHKANIGVIMDFVPVHFAVDGYGLSNYGGEPFYEYPNKDVGISEWGSCNFIHSRREVQCFLQSAADYWLSQFHFDGLRYDAVSRLIYWQGDERRGVNEVALEFLKKMNKGLKMRHPTAMLIAEDSTDFVKVTAPVEYGGLGFDYKWDLGWMHDTLEYFQTAPEYRSRDYHKLTFSMMYNYSEHFVLELSHDESVHGKATVLQKMWGDYEKKFPQARAMYTYMMLHPGKKLNFMGYEFGQLREWDEKHEQDWFMRKYPLHDSFYEYIKELNLMYRDYDCLRFDCVPDNFEWIDCDNALNCIYAFRRKGEDFDIAAVFNFSDKPKKYEFVAKDSIKAECILYSDRDIYSGKTPLSDIECKFNKLRRSVAVGLAPFSAMVIKLKH